MQSEEQERVPRDWKYEDKREVKVGSVFCSESHARSLETESWEDHEATRVLAEMNMRGALRRAALRRAATVRAFINYLTARLGFILRITVLGQRAVIFDYVPITEEFRK